MHFILHGQTELSQRRALKNADLHTHRQHKRAAMQQIMRPIHATRERYLNRPQTREERYLTGAYQTVTFDRAGEITTFVQDAGDMRAGSVYILFVQCQVLASMKNCHSSTQNLDWEITINGQYRMREINFAETEPGQLPIIFDDYPHVFTCPVTIVKKPRFLARHGRAMAELQCTNYHMFQLYLNDIEKMKEFLFIEFNGSDKIRDVCPQVFDALVARRSNIH